MLFKRVSFSSSSYLSPGHNPVDASPSTGGLTPMSQFIRQQLEFDGVDLNADFQADDTVPNDLPADQMKTLRAELVSMFSSLVDVEDVRESNAQLKEKVGSQERDITQLTATVLELSTDLRLKTKNLDSALQALLEAEKANELIQSRLNKSERKVQGFEKNQVLLKSLVESRNQVIAKLREERAVYRVPGSVADDAQVSATRQELEDVKLKLGQKDDEMAELKQQLQMVTAEKEALIEHLENDRNELSRLILEKVTIEADLRRSESKNSELKTKLTKAQKDSVAYGEALHTIVIQHQHLREANAAIFGQGQLISLVPTYLRPSIEAAVTNPQITFDSVVSAARRSFEPGQLSSISEIERENEPDTPVSSRNTSVQKHTLLVPSQPSVDESRVEEEDSDVNTSATLLEEHAVHQRINTEPHVNEEDLDPDNSSQSATVIPSSTTHPPVDEDTTSTNAGIRSSHLVSHRKGAGSDMFKSRRVKSQVEHK